jgi:uncharacterized protein (TIGR03067 family)
VWKVIYAERGNDVDGDVIGLRRVFERNKLLVEWRDRTTGKISQRQEDFSLKTDANPKQIVRSMRNSGIYVLEGDVLMMCLPASSAFPTPKDFSLPKAQNFKYLEILRREK